ncbi:succinylglutamate-semialdehyde dehydrogenase [Rhodothalassium salexigens]|uniref:succinylglutamate-semialdehyde dehydrogenase n=1 Tax=Rhodothalassium salexigens TaxID=1086 RepID=UPI001914BD00|nr:succinylglutamate-semialdehyde dehydrogenase [Rhodothalassium salexigens]MBK5912402.1 succinylglutamate-semialdehyde dehydrogenase [Rhodothalassium salexigens]MBK5920006.1 succinylglutamate-semialdehyde dehydrogenase [Rhodothalassium salexigens]
MTDTPHLIGEHWCPGSGAPFASHDPATGDTLWTGAAAAAAEVDAAVQAARAAFDGWAERGLDARVALVEAYAERLRADQDRLTQAIARETGKARWDAAGEAQAMVNKVAISLQAYRDRTGVHDTVNGALRTRLVHRPHGVMAVFGPYNFPGHLPNGHIVPALIAGNTVVFKPSELTPAVAEVMVGCWQAAGLPPGVVNLVQGGRDTGMALSGHDGVDGILFTGSAATGAALHRQLAGRPDKLLALEMGGNNPLIAWDVEEPDQAALLIAQSAYLSGGQRCTCARRLIVPEGAEGDALVDQVAALIPAIRVGAWDAEPEPFMGPLVAPAAAERVMAQVQALLDRGARALVAPERPDPAGAFVRPGLIDVSGVPDLADEEIFGPVLQVQRAADFDAAMGLANATRYGLAAGLVSDSGARWERFSARARAGIVNWNRPLPGAASTAPFGGIGISGNHRPSAYYAADYCAYPMATLANAEGRVGAVDRPRGFAP